MFEDIFTRFYQGNHAIKVIGVWGKDGLVLEKKFFSDSFDLNGHIDLDFSGAELADIITKLDRTKTATGSYFLKLIYRNNVLMIYSLTRDYFLMILTDNNILEGKLKFYIDLYRDQLISLL